MRFTLVFAALLGCWLSALVGAIILAGDLTDEELSWIELEIYVGYRTETGNAPTDIGLRLPDEVGTLLRGLECSQIDFRRTQFAALFDSMSVVFYGALEIQPETLHTRPIGLRGISGEPQIFLDIAGRQERQLLLQVKVRCSENTRYNAEVLLRAEHPTTLGSKLTDDISLYLVVTPRSGCLDSESPQSRVNYTLPKVVRRIQPAYPPLARDDCIQGSVMAQLRVEATGRVGEVIVISADHEALVETTKETLRQWVFEPAISAGREIAVYYSVNVVYKLDF